MILPPQDGIAFFAIILPLLRWVRKLKGAKTALREAKKKYARGFEENHVLLDLLWRRPELIDRYLQQMGAGLSAETKAVLIEWSTSFVQDTFLIERYLKTGAVFISATDGRTYLVYGITSELEESLSRDKLPCMVNTALLPYRGHIIYDSTMEVTPIAFDSDAAAQLNKLYLAARLKGQVIRTLPSQVPPPEEKRWNKCLEALTPFIWESVAESRSREPGAEKGNGLEEMKRELKKHPEIHLITKAQTETLEKLLINLQRTEEEWDVIRDILHSIHVVSAAPLRKSRGLKNVDGILWEDGELRVYTTLDKCEAHVKELVQKNSSLSLFQYTFLSCEEVFNIAVRRRMIAVLDYPEKQSKEEVLGDPDNFILNLVMDGKKQCLSAVMIVNPA